MLEPRCKRHRYTFFCRLNGEHWRCCCNFQFLHWWALLPWPKHPAGGVCSLHISLEIAYKRLWAQASCQHPAGEQQGTMSPMTCAVQRLCILLWYKTAKTWFKKEKKQWLFSYQHQKSHWMHFSVHVTRLTVHFSPTLKERCISWIRNNFTLTNHILCSNRALNPKWFWRT